MLVLACSISRALRKAVAECLLFMGCMSAKEARRVLNMPEALPLLHKTIRKQANPIKEKNKKALPISGYILKKIHSAEKVLAREAEYSIE